MSDLFYTTAAIGINTYMEAPENWRMSQIGNPYIPIGFALIVFCGDDGRWKYRVRFDPLGWYHRSFGSYATEEEARSQGRKEAFEMLLQLSRALLAPPPPPPPGPGPGPGPKKPAKDDIDHLQEMLGERGFKMG